MKILFHSLAALCLTIGCAAASEKLLTTVGTTIRKDGKNHAYILWQPDDASTTLGRNFAIYRKAGAASSPSSFSRLGIQTLQTSPNTIRAMFELGAHVDLAHATAPMRIDGLYREITYRADQAPAQPAQPNLDAAGKLAFILQSAVTDSRTLARLFFLGRAHPGVMMALGHAYHTNVADGVHTFEIREVDTQDQDIRVVGRVTLDTNNPIILQAPASPVQVFHPVAPGSYLSINPKDHLNARLRWGVPEGLRAQMPHTFGFDLFRVKKSTAESLGWHLTPPSPKVMLSAVSATPPTDPHPEISRVNELPILPADLLSLAEAADKNDTTRIDIADDGIWYQGPDGKPLRRPYSDGEAFYFFVAARGITGAPGELSPGTLVFMCDRLPPNPPVVESVTSQFVAPANAAQWQAQGQGGSQFLQVKIRQLPSSPFSESAKGYYVYRWSTAQSYLENLGNPVINRIGYITHQPDKTFVTFNDNGAGSPTLATHPDRSVWYTVRAVGQSACEGDTISSHSSPKAGFLRDLKAPNGVTGDFLICRHLPTASYFGREAGKNTLSSGIIIEPTRLSTNVVAADIEVALLDKEFNYQIVHNARYHYQTTDTLTINLPYAEPVGKSNAMRITVRAIAANGMISPPAVAFPGVENNPPPFAIFKFNLNTTQNCRNISTVPDSRPFHEASLVNGTVLPITGVISFPTDQGVGEWRVYRRVGYDGPLTLIAKAEGRTIPNPGTWQDGALPSASGTRVCYYGQILDQNANPGPLVLLGCTELINPDLPTPMLSPTKVAAASGDLMAVALEWFCDPVGVERFELLIATDGNGAPAPASGLSDQLSPVAVKIPNSSQPDLSFYRFQTSRVPGAIIGSGPSYKLTITLPADQTYHFAVLACGPGEPGLRSSGPTSNVVATRWLVEPTGPQPVIPWPARPLPPPFDHRLPIDTYQLGEGPLWPVILPTDFGVPTHILVGATQHDLISNSNGSESTLSSPKTPENYLFKTRTNRDEAGSLADLMPFMLFRYQEPSALFPQARANIVQCTPLIDRISWRYDDKTEPPTYVIRDPYLQFYPYNKKNALPFALPKSGPWNDTTAPVTSNLMDPPPPYLEDSTGLIFLRDLLPVTQGAKYRHLLVQYDQKGEIRRVIPLDPIQH
jgi:hypothetical protein